MADVDPPDSTSEPIGSTVDADRDSATGASKDTDQVALERSVTTLGNGRGSSQSTSKDTHQVESERSVTTPGNGRGSSQSTSKDSDQVESERAVTTPGGSHGSPQSTSKDTDQVEPERSITTPGNGRSSSQSALKDTDQVESERPITTPGNGRGSSQSTSKDAHQMESERPITAPGDGRGSSQSVSKDTNQVESERSVTTPGNERGSSQSTSKDTSQVESERATTLGRGQDSKRPAKPSSLTPVMPERRTGSDTQSRSQSGKKKACLKADPKILNPPQLSPEELRQLECSYILDGVALSQRANAEPHRTNPSLNFGIKQYNAQEDKHCQSYFKRRGVQKTLAKTKQDSGGTSMCSEVFDQLIESSEAKHELDIRNEQGAGYSYEETICGHSLPVGRPFSGYNGPNGYRRNTPNLRRNPSPFGFPGRPVHVKATTRIEGTLYTDLKS